MKFIYSFFIVLGMMFGFTPEAEAHTVQTTVVQRVCSVQKQYVAGYYDRRGRWVRGRYKRVIVCRNVPRTVVRTVHHRRHHYYRRGARVIIRP